MPFSLAMADEEKPSRNFLKRLYDELKAEGEFSIENFQAAVRRARGHAGGMAKAEKSKQAAESINAFLNRVHTALADWFRVSWSDRAVFSWAQEVFDAYVISTSNEDGRVYKIPFTTENDEIQFGDPIEVTTEYVPVGAHEIAEICADGHGARLFMEYNFATPPDWIPYLPKPGKYNSPRYGEIVITEDRNKNFVSNFENAVYQEKLPIDAEHETQLSGACGWITTMRTNDDGSVDAKVDWTDRGTKMIEEDRFKYFSPSWFEKWTDPATEETHNDIAIGGALTTRPFFKEKALRPLVANEAGISVFDGDLENLKNSDAVNLFTTLTPATIPEPSITNADEGVSMATKFDKNNPPKTMAEALTLLGSVSDELTAKETALTAKETELSTATTQAVALCDKTNPPKTLTEAITAIGEKADTGLRTASETERQATEKVTQLTETVTKQNERIETLEKDNRVSSFAEKAKDWVGDRKGHIEMLEFIVTNSEGGEESPQFKSYVESQKAIAAQRTAGLFTEVGSSAPAAGAEGKIETKAKEVMTASEGKLTYEQAYAQVIKDNPELYREYRGETQSGAAAA